MNTQITNKFVIPFLLLCFFVHSTALAIESTPSAQVSNLPAVHILPDNPLYFLKTIKERVQLLLTSNASDEANLLLSFSQKRLSEALKVAEKGKVHISEKLFEAFGRDIEAAQKKIKEVKERGQRTYGLLIELQKTIAYQKSVVEELQGEADFYSSEVGERVEALNSFLIKIDEGLVATESGKMEQRPKTSPKIFDWIRGLFGNLFGKKEILSPIAQ